MRRKNSLALIGLCLGVLSIVLTSMWVARRDRLRDAWALLSRYEPACEEATLPDDGREAGREGMDRSARAVAARWALGRETLKVVEELTAQGRSRGHELLAAGLAAARKACDPALEGAGVASARRLDLPDLEAHRRRAAAHGDLRFVKLLLGRLLPMTEEESGRRADRYGERFADAVSEEMATWVEARSETPRVAATDLPARPPAKTSNGSSRLFEEDAEPSGGGEPPRIVIHSASGESWGQIRDRRARERALRVVAWRPLAARELEPVLKLRRALDRLLETDSLAGGADICNRLGEAARATDRAVVREAPDRRASSAVGRMLDGYALAGRACSESRYAIAFVALTDADAGWLRVVGASGSGGGLEPRTGLAASLRPSRSNAPSRR